MTEKPDYVLNFPRQKNTEIKKIGNNWYLYERFSPDFLNNLKNFTLLSLELQWIAGINQLSGFVGNYFIDNFNRSLVRIVEAVSTALSGSMSHARRISSQSAPSVFFCPFSSVAEAASTSRLLQVYR